MQEEDHRARPALLVLTQRPGLSTPMTAVMMSVRRRGDRIGHFSPINPFQVLIAQKVAALPQGSGALFRARDARRGTPALDPGNGPGTRGGRARQVDPRQSAPALGSASRGRGGLVITIVLVAFAVFVWGRDRPGLGLRSGSGLFLH